MQLIIRQYPTNLRLVINDGGRNQLLVNNNPEIIKLVLRQGDFTVIGGSSAWGGITGTLSSQADLQTALDSKVNDTGNETIAGVKTFSSDPIIPDEAYGAGWNGSLEPPTKNAVYDKIETIVADTSVDYSTIFLFMGG